ncbi:hypothetical protein MSKOL_2077 [Methanosarcina sp. Kolksee]|uniref:LPO_1073/Vpar_1526 family protein n=1 Tax=Methanosarcina sp. Kolksee TaxID=1434099 RepID=UPI00061552E1|nr:LPO_1073/Vpar_1526 family protein [Methanosarcina sp. Kolksee]AKB47854.1 hypothetical protein MSKOL_2077 [Methanosarcina sp. Kolksee]
MFNREHTTQSIGSNSSGNNQAQGDIIIYNGLSYGDVKTICMEVFKQNFYELSIVAKEIATQRVEELINKFLHQLMSENQEGLNQVVDPDFQYALYIAQRDYARCGDPALFDMLIRLLIERTKETERSLLQIVLNESIAVVSKLTKEELDTLTALFVIEYHSKDYKFDNIPGFVNYINTYILPFWKSIKKENSLFAHLQYAGCGVYTWVGTTGLERFLDSRYKGPVENRTNVRTCDIRFFIEKEDSRISSLFDKFDMSILNHMYLTSVGIAIGHANLFRRVTGEEFNLSKWL